MYFYTWKGREINMSKFSFLISLLQTNHHNDSGSDECSPYSTKYFQRLTLVKLTYKNYCWMQVYRYQHLTNYLMTKKTDGIYRLTEQNPTIYTDQKYNNQCYTNKKKRLKYTAHILESSQLIKPQLNWVRWPITSKLCWPVRSMTGVSYHQLTTHNAI